MSGLKAILDPQGSDSQLCIGSAGLIADLGKKTNSTCACVIRSKPSGLPSMMMQKLITTTVGVGWGVGG